MVEICKNINTFNCKKCAVEEVNYKHDFVKRIIKSKLFILRIRNLSEDTLHEPNFSVNNFFINYWKEIWVELLKYTLEDDCIISKAIYKIIDKENISESDFTNDFNKIFIWEGFLDRSKLVGVKSSERWYSNVPTTLNEYLEDENETSYSIITDVIIEKSRKIRDFYDLNNVGEIIDKIIDKITYEVNECKSYYNIFGNASMSWFKKENESEYHLYDKIQSKSIKAFIKFETRKIGMYINENPEIDFNILAIDKLFDSESLFMFDDNYENLSQIINSLFGNIVFSKKYLETVDSGDMVLNKDFPYMISKIKSYDTISKNIDNDFMEKIKQSDVFSDETAIFEKCIKNKCIDHIDIKEIEESFKEICESRSDEFKIDCNNYYFYRSTVRRDLDSYISYLIKIYCINSNFKENIKELISKFHEFHDLYIAVIYIFAECVENKIKLSSDDVKYLKNIVQTGELMHVLLLNSQKYKPDTINAIYNKWFEGHNVIVKDADEYNELINYEVKYTLPTNFSGNWDLKIIKHYSNTRKFIEDLIEQKNFNCNNMHTLLDYNSKEENNSILNYCILKSNNDGKSLILPQSFINLIVKLIGSQKIDSEVIQKCIEVIEHEHIKQKLQNALLTMQQPH